MTASRSQIWVIAYDSPSDKRRRKLAKLLEGHGLRVQWSVCQATSAFGPLATRKLVHLTAC